MKIGSLDTTGLDIARNTMSAYAFYYVVGDALINKKSLSVVRMGDGEVALYRAATAMVEEGNGSNIVTEYNPEWRQRMGIDGISYNEILRRMDYAAMLSSHFAPNVNGLVQDNFSLYKLMPRRDFYVDNFFVNIWTDQYQAELVKASSDVIFIHRNRSTADAIQKRIKNHFGKWTTYIEMSNWQEAESVIEKACNLDKPNLVLFAGGPANKYIAPRIAESGKVVLDIGNATDKWTFANYTP